MSIYDVLDILREKGPLTAGEIQEELLRTGRASRVHQDVTKLARRGLLVARGERKNGPMGHAAVVWGIA